MVKILMDTHEFDELLLDVMVQACGTRKGVLLVKSGHPFIEDGELVIDNECLSAYEAACDYLTERGYLKTLNGRIYNLNKKKEVKPNSSHD